MKKRIFRAFLGLLGMAIVACNSKPDPSGIWSAERARTWYQAQGWLRGANFVPSSAINQLEMWQAETFDPETIDRELGWAAAIGMNCMRVYLHHAAWNQDSEGFKQRVGDYLAIADKHGMKTMFVFLDDCWEATFQSGKQPAPKPGVHNSGWLRDPGDLYYTGDKAAVVALLERYVKDVLQTFRDDQRILLWDLYNEPGGSGPYRYNERSLPLLKQVFTWARAVNPSQPLSSGVWDWNLKELNEFQLENSDIITYHSYEGVAAHKAMVDSLKQYGRPLICTEYMARTQESTFQSIMPMLKAENVGAINWGLVAGKTNTIFAWDTPLPDLTEPPVWFHDIFRSDGTAYAQQEIDAIKQLTK